MNEIVAFFTRLFKIPGCCKCIVCTLRDLNGFHAHSWLSFACRSTSLRPTCSSNCSIQTHFYVISTNKRSKVVAGLGLQIFFFALCPASFQSGAIICHPHKELRIGVCHKKNSSSRPSTSEFPQQQEFHPAI